MLGHGRLSCEYVTAPGGLGDECRGGRACGRLRTPGPGLRPAIRLSSAPGGARRWYGRRRGAAGVSPYAGVMTRRLRRPVSRGFVRIKAALASPDGQLQPALGRGERAGPAGVVGAGGMVGVV